MYLCCTKFLIFENNQVSKKEPGGMKTLDKGSAENSKH